MIKEVIHFIKTDIFVDTHYEDERLAKNALMRKVAFFGIPSTILFSLLFLFTELYISALCIFGITILHCISIYLSTKKFYLLPRLLEASVQSFLIFLLAVLEFPYSVRIKLLIIMLNLALISLSFIYFSAKEWIYTTVIGLLIFVYGGLYEYVGPKFCIKEYNVLSDSKAFETVIYLFSFVLLSYCFIKFKKMLENKVKSINELLQQTSKQKETLQTQSELVQFQNDALTKTVNELTVAEEEIRQRNEEIAAQRDAFQAQTVELSQTLDLLKQSQSKLIESEKMVALGQLIAGVAHEINTPLGAIRSSVGNISNTLNQILKTLPSFFEKLNDQDKDIFFSMLEESIKQNIAITSKEERAYKRNLISLLEDAEVQNADEYADTLVDMGIYENISAYIELFKRNDVHDILQMAYKLSGLLRSSQTIKTATDRASKVVFALKNFAHYDLSGEMIETNIIESVETVITLYYNQLKHGVTLVKNFEQIPTTLCYPDELNQVWTNIIHNGLQAMEYVGTLTIDISEDDTYISVSFTDSGKGIPVEIQDKVFNAFFTTKAQGEGSGLGLDIVKRIIEKHNAKISFTSIPGETKFTVQLLKIHKTI